MKRVVLCTPIKNGVDSNYLKYLIPLIQRGLPGVQLDTLFLEGPSINFARNSCASETLRLTPKGKLVFLDDDIANWSDKDIDRIVSHPVDIVGGAYCKRKPGIPQWLFVPRPGAEVQESGLLECTGVATGFLCIDLDVFPKIAEKFPEHAFLAKDSPEDSVRLCYDWFRMGVVGPDTAESKLEEIEKIIFNCDPRDLERRVADIVFRRPKPGRLLGEDYYFCRMARKAGFKVWVDLGLPILAHIGKAAFPITQDQVGCGANREFAMPAAEDF